MPLASFSSWNQTIKPRPCSGGLNDQQPYSPGQRLGFFMPCDNCAPEGQKHFPPNDNAFALSGRRLLCYPCSPGCYPGLMDQCPFQGRIRQNNYFWWALQMGGSMLLLGHIPWDDYFHWALQMFVLDTLGLQIWLNDDLSINIRILTPKKQGVLVTKGSFGQKNAVFCGFR